MSGVPSKQIAADLGVLRQLPIAQQLCCCSKLASSTGLIFRVMRNVTEMTENAKFSIRYVNVSGKFGQGGGCVLN